MIDLPDFLGYASPSEFLDKLKKKIPGDKVSVRWYADGQQYEGFLTEWESDGWCWVEFLEYEGVWIPPQDLTVIRQSAVVQI